MANGFHMNKPKLDWIMSNWEKYDLVDSKSEMTALLNVLEKHDENLDSLHDVIFNNNRNFCDIYFNEAKSDRDVVKGLFEYNLFFASEEEFVKFVEENAEESETTAEYFLENFLDYKETSDGYVVQLHY